MRKCWKLRIKPIFILSYLPGIFYIANLIRMLGLSTFYYYVSVAVAGGIGLLAALLTKNYRMTRIWLFAALYLFTLAVSWLIIRNIPLSDIFLTALLIGIAILMIIRPWGYRFGIVTFYLSAFILIYRMSGAGSLRILTSSSNYISIVILLAVFFYYISIDNTDRQLRLIDVLPAVMCFLISVWARGRGGILSCTFLLVMILICYLRSITNKNARKTVVVFVALIIAGSILYYKNFSFIDSFMGLGKWASRGTDNSARMYIWMSYFSKVKESVKYLFFGAPLDKISAVMVYGGNLHNSFIQLHAYNGILMLIAVSVYICKSGVYFLKQKNFISLVMMMTMVIRGLSDKFIFGQYGMPIMVYFILRPYVTRQRTS